MNGIQNGLTCCSRRRLPIRRITRLHYRDLWSCLRDLLFLDHPAAEQETETDAADDRGVKKGDKASPSGDPWRVASVKESTVVVKVDDGTRIEFSKSAISSVSPVKTEEKAETAEEPEASLQKRLRTSRLPICRPCSRGPAYRISPHSNTHEKIGVNRYEQNSPLFDRHCSARRGLHVPFSEHSVVFSDTERGSSHRSSSRSRFGNIPGA